MTIGISKEKLENLIYTDDYCNALINANEALEACTELNPWLPIEQAPKNRKVLLKFPMQDGGYEYAVDFAFEPPTLRDWNMKGMPAIKPTHYQELPGDPD